MPLGMSDLPILQAISMAPDSKDLESAGDMAPSIDTLARTICSQEGDSSDLNPASSEQYESRRHQTPPAPVALPEAASLAVTLVDSNASPSKLPDPSQSSGIYAANPIKSDDDTATTAFLSPSVSAGPLWEEDEDKSTNTERDTNFLELTGDIQLRDEYEDQRLTPPPSSSPATDLGTLSSPIRQPDSRPKDGCHHSPTSSSARQDAYGDNDIMAIAQAGKRKRNEGLSENEDHLVSAPNPKRPTNKLQRLQHEKLKLPFRSPLLPKQEDQREGNLGICSTTPRLTPQIGQVTQEANNGKGASLGFIKETNQRYRTAKAATQFKSPLPLSVVSKLGHMVRMTPNVQGLERKLQVLKRALKIKQQNQEEILEDLTQKWTDAGKEVAWELWSLVKDSAPESESRRTDKNAVGWSELEDCRGRNESLSAGMFNPIDEDVGNSEHQEIDAVRNNLGTMLRQLGIDPKTIGCEEESVFEDQ